MTVTNKETERVYMVGSEWLYYNIYMGPQSSDNLLTSIIPTITDKLLQDQRIDKWFFIRFRDENGLHLRVRFHTTSTKHINSIIQEFHALTTPFVKNHLINDLQIRTYKREIERYGNHTMEESESLFFSNSELILNIIKLTEQDQELRWLYGMKAIDVFLDGWGLNLKSKKALLEERKNVFGEEFGVNKPVRKQLSKKYRLYKGKIESILTNELPEQARLALDTFANKNHTVIPNIIQKVKIYNENPKDVIEDLLASYIHMHCNRLFQSKQRLNEWVLYDLLYQYYYSRLARKTKQNQNIGNIQKQQVS